MGATKTDHFSEDLLRQARQFKALGHPARLAIVDFLRRSSACICGDIVDELPLAQPTVSQHLRELKEAGLIRGTIEGTAICYCLDTEAIRSLEAVLQQLLPDPERAQPCC